MRRHLIIEQAIDRIIHHSRIGCTILAPRFTLSKDIAGAHPWRFQDAEFDNHTSSCEALAILSTYESISLPGQRYEVATTFHDHTNHSHGIFNGIGPR